MIKTPCCRLVKNLGSSIYLLIQEYLQLRTVFTKAFSGLQERRAVWMLYPVNIIIIIIIVLCYWETTAVSGLPAGVRLKVEKTRIPHYRHIPAIHFTCVYVRHSRLDWAMMRSAGGNTGGFPLEVMGIVTTLSRARSRGLS